MLDVLHLRYVAIIGCQMGSVVEAGYKADWSKVLATDYLLQIRDQGRSRINLERGAWVLVMWGVDAVLVEIMLKRAYRVVAGREGVEE